LALGTGNSADHDVARRLTAVLAADVVGYSRLMAKNEVGALNQLKSLRGTVIDPLVTRHRGEIVGSAGDSFLIAFASAVDSVSCALAWQQACAEASEALVAGQRMLFRIGIHLCDVIPEGGTIYGDGVNIAARLEKLAQPGGLVVSRAIRDQVEGRLDLAFIDLGRQELKNIPRPVEAFEVQRSGTTPRPADQTMGSASASAKLSLAILPFSNMSGDKEQDYFSDGITEDIITEISRFRELRVIARNSSFAFRGQNIDIGEIARKLGVQFVVEGSVRKAGNRLRITAQLIEAASDRHVWAERYDRDLDDVFAIQGEISQTIASIVAGHVKTAGAARSKARPTESLTAYDLFLQARASMSRHGLNEECAPLLTRAIELDPDYAMAHALMANMLMNRTLYDGDLATRERATEYARRAIALDPNEPWGHGMLGFCLTFLHRLPEAGMHFDRARQLNPNDVFIAVLHANWHCFSGHAEQAIAGMQEALKLDPFGHEWYWGDYCVVLVVAQRYEEAVAAYEKMVAPAPWSYAFAAIAHVNMGNLERARDLAKRCLEANPGFPPEDYFLTDPYIDPAVPERMIADFRKAL
jgi:adenylate cyclase